MHLTQNMRKVTPSKTNTDDPRAWIVVIIEYPSGTCSWALTPKDPAGCGFIPKTLLAALSEIRK